MKNDNAIKVLTKYDKLIGKRVSFYNGDGDVEDIIEGHRRTYAVVYRLYSSSCQIQANINMLVPIDDIRTVDRINIDDFLRGKRKYWIEFETTQGNKYTDVIEAYNADDVINYIFNFSEDSIKEYDYRLVEEENKGE